MRPRPRPGRSPSPPELTTTMLNAGSALAWVLLAMCSVASSMVALWVTLALVRTTGQQGANGLGQGVGVWVWALVITLGLPLGIALWKHHGDTARLSRTMVWLPLVWNSLGLLIATKTIPDVVGTALRRQGASVPADSLGDSHSATRMLSALGHDVADRVDPDGIPAAMTSTLQQWTATDGGQIDRDKALAVPFTDEGTAIVIDATLAGAAGSVTLPYLFDTGASFSTISSETAARLGILVPEDAPVLTFNTASGQRQSRMVYLPSLRLGDVEIRGLLASVCDGCVNTRHQGLLGQNVMRQFFAQIDFKNQRMVLLPRKATTSSNRAYDIEPMVELQVEGEAEVWLGRVRWVIQVHNRGTVPITEVTPVVKFTDGPVLRGATIANIAPNGVGRSLVEGRVTLDHKRGSRGPFTLGLAEAFW